MQSEWPFEYFMNSKKINLQYLSNTNVIVQVGMKEILKIQLGPWTASMPVSFWEACPFVHLSFRYCMTVWVVIWERQGFYDHYPFYKPHLSLFIPTLQGHLPLVKKKCLINKVIVLWCTIHLWFKTPAILSRSLRVKYVCFSLGILYNVIRLQCPEHIYYIPHIFHCLPKEVLLIFD